jgi:predicted MFS family arabinose efflux permease
MGRSRGRERQPFGGNPVVHVLLPFAAAYCLSYLYRSVNAVIAPDLARDFALSAASLGLLTSAYFLTFAAFQLPLGLLLDRFGPRRTDATLLVVAALGALLFAFAPALPLLIAGRALVGLGVSGCLMSGIKANVMWFPLSRLGSMNGWIFFAGGLGLIAATVPVEAAVKLADWRVVFLILALLTVAAAALVFLVVPERAGTAAYESLPAQLDGLSRVFGERRFWQIAVLAITLQSTSMAVQGLWAGPWLRDVAGLAREAVAFHLFVMACATTIGFLFWGQFAARLARHGVSILSVYVFGMGVFLLFQLLVTVGFARGALLWWVGYGFFGTAGSLSYAILPHRFAPSLAGRVNTALNCMVFAWAFVVQWGVGAVISLYPATATGYDPDGYRAGFGVFLAVQAGAWAWTVAATRRAAVASDPAPANKV